MKIGAPKEIADGEARVALTPESAARLQKLGYECLVESGGQVPAEVESQMPHGHAATASWLGGQHTQILYYDQHHQLLWQKDILKGQTGQDIKIIRSVGELELLSAFPDATAVLDGWTRAHTGDDDYDTAL